MEEKIGFYTAIIEANSALDTKLKRKIHMIGTIRLMLVLGLMGILIVLSDLSWQWLGGISIVFVATFGALMILHYRLSGRREYVETLIALCRDELRGFDYDFSPFDGAPEAVDPEHSFSYDLDIFGKRSFFQSINRTVTHGGKERLADWFKKTLTSNSAIKHRQEAVRELSLKSKLRHNFYVTGSLKKGDQNDTAKLHKLLRSPIDFVDGRLWSALIWIVPVGWLLLVLTVVLGFLNEGVLAAYFVVCALVANIKIKQINKLHSSVDRTEKILSTHSRLMKIIETEQFESPMMRDIKARLDSGGGSASAAVMELSKLLNKLDQRANLFVMIINVLILRDIKVAMGIKKWRLTNLDYVDSWFDAMAEFDAVSSLATFSFNHPDYIYPQITDTYFSMCGKGLGHPLLDRAVCVKNDISIEKDPYFLIVTGANMAGKSTYLRTVGINFVLACVGAAVCAEELTVYASNLVTSLRTSDSLSDNESYFFAELKRLKMIIDRLGGGGGEGEGGSVCEGGKGGCEYKDGAERSEGERLFIILDEILKGTNSTDKQKGSLALIRQFVRLRTCGIIATHDLLLGTLANEFPHNISNYRFEADIAHDKLTFSYQMREGVAQNMNASFLMKKMGITL